MIFDAQDDVARHCPLIGRIAVRDSLPVVPMLLGCSADHIPNNELESPVARRFAFAGCRALVSLCHRGIGSSRRKTAAFISGILKEHGECRFHRTVRMRHASPRPRVHLAGVFRRLRLAVGAVTWAQPRCFDRTPDCHGLEAGARRHSGPPSFRRVWALSTRGCHESSRRSV